MKKVLRAAGLVLVAAALFATLVVQSAAAGSPPNRLDPPSGGPVGLVADACNTILGPFKDISDFFNLDVCPSAAGRVIANPHIWNVFASDNWDAQHPASLSTAAINDLTRGIVDTSPGNNYFGPAGQYGVGAARFDGSSQNNGCTGAPSGTTNFLSILLWVTCEVQAPLTGVPYPDDNTLYVVYLPASVDVDNGPFGGTCDGWTAYHFFSMALTVDWVTEDVPDPTDPFGDPIKIPVPPFFHAHFQSYPFVVIPLKCAMQDFPGTTRGVGPLHPEWVSDLASNEIMEAATDPIVPSGWLDRSTIGFNDDVFKKGEIADICQGGGSAPASHRRLDNGVVVAPYWSNQDGACVPKLHTLDLQTVGLPDGVTANASVASRSIYGDDNRHNQPLPYAFCGIKTLTDFATGCITENAHVSWSFDATVQKAGETGVRYRTASTGGDTFMDRDITDKAIYGKEYQLTTATSPAVVKSLATTITQDQWVSAGSNVSVTTDYHVPTGDDRYEFRNWSWTGGGSSTDSSTSIKMDGPKTATGNYVLQHELTFAQTGIPAGLPWNVTVAGSEHSGPYSQWFDQGPNVAFSFQDPVPGATLGTRYKLVSVDAPSPLSVTAKRTITATYKKQYLLTVNTSGLPSPNLTTITNGGTALGTANDSTPLQAWIDDGATLSLAGDANVDGVDGTQYFAQQFAPAPPATMSGPVTTTLTYKTMAQLINEALASGGISGASASGFSLALKLQFAAVQADMGAHRYGAALGDLTSFVNTIIGQCCTPKSGKEITQALARTFELDAMLVYRNALCKGIAAGQIGTTAARNDYAYYSKLVASLGGNVLPQC